MVRDREGIEMKEQIEAIINEVESIEPLQAAGLYGSAHAAIQRVVKQLQSLAGQEAKPMECDHDYKHGGWKQKYIIHKADGRPVDPSAIYFVLRLDEDPHARWAARCYSNSVAVDNVKFATDILDMLKKIGKGCSNQNPSIAHPQQVCRWTADSSSIAGLFYVTSCNRNAMPEQKGTFCLFCGLKIESEGK
jgi:hypothetical protein